MAQPYWRIDTTADVGLLASGATIEALFANMAKGLFSLICPLPYIRRALSHKVHLEAASCEDLLIAWLNELIFIHETERLLFREFAISLLDGGLLDAVCTGEAVDMERHPLRMEVKAATYHKASIRQALKGTWRAKVILDV